MCATCDGFFLLQHNMASWNVFRDEWFFIICCSFSFEAVSFFVSCLECPNSLSFNSFNLQQRFLCRFQWTTGHLDISYHPLGSRLKPMLELTAVLAFRDAVLEFGRLVWSVMDLMVLRFWCGCFWRIFSEKRQCWMVLFDLLQYLHQAAYFSFLVLKVQIRRNSIHCFCEVLIEDSNGRWDIN